MIKRALDIVVSATALLALSPVLLLVAIAVRYDVGPPILFRQIRPGLGGAPFCMVKFRTMREARDASGNTLGDADRLTKLGRLLRATSLDELPELWNVLTGDMSLVGPRPLLMEYLPRYSPEQRRRHDVRPGITGWAQINGRNALDWPQRLAMDVWYVDNRSLGLDLRILWMTVSKVLAREGINAEGETTMSKFQNGGER